MEIRSILSSNSSPREYLALSSIQDCAVLRRNTKIKRVLPTEVHSAVFEIDVNVMKFYLGVIGDQNEGWLTMNFVWNDLQVFLIFTVNEIFKWLQHNFKVSAK